MPMPPLTIVERQNIDNGPWFSKLSPALQEGLLARASVRRLADGEFAGTRGANAKEWCGVALGAVRVSSVSLAGKQVALMCFDPGAWFGDIALFDGLPRTHDGHAHGPTTLRVEPSRLIVLSHDKLFTLSEAH
jgi:CRP-like cAMP-binding protein